MSSSSSLDEDIPPTLELSQLSTGLQSLPPTPLLSQGSDGGVLLSLPPTPTPSLPADVEALSPAEPEVPTPPPLPAYMRPTGCCSNNCMDQFTEEEIALFQTTFKKLTKVDQYLFLFNLSRGKDGQTTRGRRSWECLGKTVCRTAMGKLTRASTRIQKFRQAVLAHQTLPPPKLPYPKRASPATQDALDFLAWMYEAVAETLPNVDSPDVDIADCANAEPITALEVAYAEHLWGKRSKASAEPESAEGDGEVKYLPHGTWYEAWQLYQADRRANGIVPAAFVTFWAAWRTHFKHKLVWHPALAVCYSGDLRFCDFAILRLCDPGGLTRDLFCDYRAIMRFFRGEVQISGLRYFC